MTAHATSPPSTTLRRAPLAGPPRRRSSVSLPRQWRSSPPLPCLPRRRRAPRSRRSGSTPRPPWIWRPGGACEAGVGARPRADASVMASLGAGARHGFARTPASWPRQARAGAALPGADEPVEGKLGTGAPFVAGSGASRWQRAAPSSQPRRPCS
jgi:hypothetical protein